MESGFQAGREYSANLVDEIVVEFIKEQLAQLDDEVIRANDSMADWKMKLECLRPVMFFGQNKPRKANLNWAAGLEQ